MFSVSGEGAPRKEHRMPPIMVLDTPQITVRYYPENKIVHHEMHQYTHGKDFRDALMAGLDAMKRNGARKWLSDDRKNPVFNADDQQWAREVWSPAVIKAGWKYWAIVEPERALARARMEERAERYSQLGVTVKTFSDPEEALKWLKSQ
jgi:hypothetical protein